MKSKPAPHRKKTPAKKRVAKVTRSSNWLVTFFRSHKPNIEQFKRVGFAAMIAGMGMFLLTLLPYLGYNLLVEDDLIKWTTLLKRTTKSGRGEGEQFFRDSVTLIDVSSAKVIKKANEGDTVATNLSAIDSVLVQLSRLKKRERFVICDISPFYTDTLLGKLSHQMGNILFPYEPDDFLRHRSGIDSTKTAQVESLTNTGLELSSILLKYRLFDEQDFKHLSIVWFERAEKRPVERLSGLFCKYNDHLQLNFGLLDPRVRESIIKNVDGEQPYQVSNFLGRCETPGFMAEHATGKYIIIGDFKGDVHSVAIGKMPGSLILLNEFLSIKDEDNRLLGWGMLIEWLGLAILACAIMYPSKSVFWCWFFQLFTSPVGKIVSKTLVLLLFIWTLSAIDYIYFDKYINVIAIMLIVGIYEFFHDIRKLNFKWANGWRGFFDLFKPEKKCTKRV